MKDDFDPIDFAKRSAVEAIDQIDDWGNSTGKAIMAYIVNVRDTLSEYDCVDKLDDAINAFCHTLTILTGKYCVPYMKLDEPVSKYHTAIFDNLEDAQLWWDSIFYLRNIYMINSRRPR